ALHSLSSRRNERSCPDSLLCAPHPDRTHLASAQEKDKHVQIVRVTSTTLTVGRPRACSAPCVWELDGQGNPASCASRRRCWQGNSRTSGGAYAGARSLKAPLSPATRIRYLTALRVIGCRCSETKSHGCLSARAAR